MSGIVHLDKAAAGWIITTNDNTVYQGKCRLMHTSHNTKFRSTTLAILASIEQYQQAYYENECPNPNQKIIIYTTDRTIATRLKRHYRSCTVPSKQFEQENESIRSLYDFLQRNKQYQIVVLEKQVNKNEVS